MKTLLTAVIEERRLIRLLYDGVARTVEAHLLGKDEHDEDVFLGRQVHPALPEEESWQVFRLRKVYELMRLDARFDPPAAGPELPVRLLSCIRPMA